MEVLGFKQVLKTNFRFSNQFLEKHQTTFHYYYLKFKFTP